jgi:hypothetical protein
MPMKIQIQIEINAEDFQNRVKEVVKDYFGVGWESLGFTAEEEAEVFKDALYCLECDLNDMMVDGHWHEVFNYERCGDYLGEECQVFQDKYSDWFEKRDKPKQEREADIKQAAYIEWATRFLQEQGFDVTRKGKKS